LFLAFSRRGCPKTGTASFIILQLIVVFNNRNRFINHFIYNHSEQLIYRAVILYITTHNFSNNRDIPGFPSVLPFSKIIIRMKKIIPIILFLFLHGIAVPQNNQYTWKYYTTGSTGILGDNAEAIWVDYDGNPYIAAYTAGWEEGGFSKFFHTENTWVNYSNVEYPVIGSIYDVGSSRISDIEEDANGILWMATWRGILKFDPAIGGNSLEFWGASNSLHPGGKTNDIAVATDGTIWATINSVIWGNGGLVHLNPTTNVMQYWGYGSTANNWPSLIGYCDHVSVQPKSNGGYMVYIDGEGWNTMITFDSDSEEFNLLPQNNIAGEIVALPGDDCIDDEGNLWALRYSSAGNPFSLDYLTPDGIWVTPEQPSAVIADIWAFKAFGNHEALITGLSSEIWQFSGSAWQSKGIWREGAYTYALDIDNAGNIWVSGMEGAAKHDVLTGQWQRYRITNSSQTDYWVEDLTFDDQGNLWLTGNAGTGVGGFQKFDGTNWTGFNEYNYGLGFPFPFPTDNTEAICFRPSNGQIVVNPMYGFLHAWNGQSYNSLNYPNARSEGLVEDSQNRLWSLGEYYDLKYYNDANNSWTSVDFTGLGANIRKDPTLSGTIWACSGYQVLRTDGINNYLKTVEDFNELNPQSDYLTTAIPGSENAVWVGSNQGLFKLDVTANTYQFFSPSNSGIPGENITPLAYTPDGKIWFTNFGSVATQQNGLCWYDGTEFGFFAVEDGGLPHSQIKDMEIKLTEDGYELWMSCLSRGIAVLEVKSLSTGISQFSARDGSLNFTNYPNPFSTSTALNFTLDEAGFVSLNIYDVSGSLISNLVNQPLQKGKWSFNWNTAIQPHAIKSSGIYIATLKTQKSVSSIKIIQQ
jgi:streptogramin lyase